MLGCVPRSHDALVVALIIVVVVVVGLIIIVVGVTVVDTLIIVVVVVTVVVALIIIACRSRGIPPRIDTVVASAVAITVAIFENDVGVVIRRHRVRTRKNSLGVTRQRHAIPTTPAAPPPPPPHDVE